MTEKDKITVDDEINDVVQKTNNQLMTEVDPDIADEMGAFEDEALTADDAIEAIINENDDSE